MRALKTRLTGAARDVLARLKNETAGAHARVDAVAEPMLRDRTRYCRLLLGLRDAHCAVEPELARHAAGLLRAGYDVEKRSKVAWLEQDLAFLGAGDGEAPVRNSSFSLGCTAAAMGAVYVTEGATLGGQVIARHVMPMLSLSPTAGCRYFAGYGAATRDRWRSTCDAIVEYAASATEPNAIQDMIAAARETFALFESAFLARDAP